MDQLRIFKTSVLQQQQQNFNQKLRSKRIQSGSVVSSDGGLPFDAKHYVNKGYLTYRCKNSSHREGIVHSTDSGCSVGGGYSSTQESEFEDSTAVVTHQEAKIQPKVLRCAKCCRQKREKSDASTQSDEVPPKASNEPIIVVTLPPSSDKIVQCRVVRDRSTMISSIYPTYYMYQEKNGQPHVLLLVARKRKKCSTSRYVISTKTENLRRRSTSVVGELVSNFVGTTFRLTSYGWEENEASKSESCLIIYEPNILGTEGPRRIKVLFPHNRETTKQKGIFAKGRHQSTGGGNTLQLVNKEPEWEAETQSHVLYFHGRVTRSSVKNFQLCRPPSDSIVLQFGKIDADEFTLDYQAPLDAVRAFAIALSSFDHKIGCE